MKLTLILGLLTATSLVLHGASFSTAPSADAFVASGPTGNLATNNFGSGGGISVAAPGLSQGEMQSVLQFNLAGAVSSFNNTFGAGQWSIQSMTLQLTATLANNPIFNAAAAGLFAISWMQNDSWVEGTGSPGAPGTSGITLASLQSTFISPGDESLGMFSFSGATSGAFTYSLGLPPGLTADALAGNNVSLRLSAADSTVSGVFNSRTFSTVANRPSLTVVAVPEPSTFALGALGLALLAGQAWARRRRK